MNKAAYLRALGESSSSAPLGEESPHHAAIGDQSLARIFEARAQSQRRARTRRWLFVTFALAAAVGAGGATIITMLASAHLPLLDTAASARASIAPQPVGARKVAASLEAAASPLTTSLPRGSGPTAFDGGPVDGDPAAPSTPVATLEHAVPGGGASSRTELPHSVVIPTNLVRPPTAREQRPEPSPAPRRATPSPKRRTTPSAVAASATAATPPIDVGRPTSEDAASPIGESTSSPHARVDLEGGTGSSLPSVASIATPRTPSSRIATALRPLSPVLLWSEIMLKLEKLPRGERDPAPESETVHQP